MTTTESFCMATFRMKLPMVLMSLWMMPTATEAWTTILPSLASSSSLSQRQRMMRPFPTTSTTATTQLHLALDPSSLTVASALTALDTFWQTEPYTAAAIACGVKASAADIVAQQSAMEVDDDDEELVVMEVPQVLVEQEQEESTTTTDYKRTMAFLVYGSLYQGMSQEYIYNHLYPTWFGSGTSWDIVLMKVGFDLLIQTTLVTLPVAYLIKGCLFQQSPFLSLKQYVGDIRDQQLLQSYYMLWGPVQMLTFSVVPEHYRVTFIAAVSFFWLIRLSQIAANSTDAVLVDVDTDVKTET